MTRIEFLDELNIRLAAGGVPSAKDILSFYDEAIRDRMDSGMPEELAVADVGNISEIVREAKAEMPMPLVVRNVFTESREEAKRNGNGWLWLIICIVCLPFIMSVLGAMFGVFVSMWSVVFALYVVVFALSVSGVAVFASGFLMFLGYFPSTVALGLFGAGLLLLGISMMLITPANLFAKLMSNIIKLIFGGIKKLIVR